MITNGVHGLTPLGSTGEFAYLNWDQKIGIVAEVVEGATGSIPVVVVTGGGLECTAKQLESLVLMRVMTGSMYNAAIDNKFMGSMTHLTAKDGFFYSPYSKAAWNPDYIGGAPPGHDLDDVR